MKSRRRIAFPKAGTTPNKDDYSKDLRPTKWGHGTNRKARMRNVRFVPKADIVPHSLLCVPRENVILCRRHRNDTRPTRLASLKLGLNLSDVASFRKVLASGASLIVGRSIDMERFQQSPTDHPTEVFLLLSQA